MSLDNCHAAHSVVWGRVPHTCLLVCLTDRFRRGAVRIIFTTRHSTTPSQPARCLGSFLSFIKGHFTGRKPVFRYVYPLTKQQPVGHWGHSHTGSRPTGCPWQRHSATNSTRKLYHDRQIFENHQMNFVKD